MYKSMYGLYLKGVNACISLSLESVLIFPEAKGLSCYYRVYRVNELPPGKTSRAFPECKFLHSHSIPPALL